MTKRFGFTLAEVLITLGILGVVAAMTIPTLIANTNSAKFRAQFKKTLSTLNQAGLMAQAQYDFDYSSATSACAQTAAANSPDNPNNIMSFCSLLNGTLTGFTFLGKPADITTDANSTSGGGATYTISNAAATQVPTATHVYALADGSYVGFADAARAATGVCQLDLGAKIDSAWIAAHPNCRGYIDVNGKTLPNKGVSCTAGTTTTDVTKPCEVKNDATHMTDVFPIVFHDATVEPASDAAKYILTTAK